MSRSAILVVIALLAGIALGVTLPEAHADPAPPSAVCQWTVPPLTMEKGAANLGKWIDEQRATGHDQFISWGSYLCAY